MKMKKLFAGLLATSIVAAGTSAFAAPIANDAGYDKTAGTYSIVSDLSGYGADQMTILIIPEAAYNAGTINDADILYIDQAAANTENIFKSVGILGGTTLADGNYYVKIGGENIAEDGIIVEKFTVKNATVESKKYLYGDVDDTYGVQSTDALQVLYHAIGGDSVLDDGAAWRKIAANVKTVDDEDISSIDALQILYYAIGGDSIIDTLPEYFTID